MVIEFLRSHRWVRRSLSGLSVVLLLGGLALVGYPFFTNIWQGRIQDSLEDQIVSPELQQAYKDRRVSTGDSLTRIRIPALNVDTVVVEGITPSALRAGAGHYPTTALPCEGGNVAIAGHRTTYGRPFGNLDQLKTGDTIDLITPIGACQYRITRDPFVTAADRALGHPADARQERHPHHVPSEGISRPAPGRQGDVGQGHQGDVNPGAIDGGRRRRSRRAAVRSVASAAVLLVVGVGWASPAGAHPDADGHGSISLSATGDLGSPPSVSGTFSGASALGRVLEYIDSVSLTVTPTGPTGGGPVGVDGCTKVTSGKCGTGTVSFKWQLPGLAYNGPYVVNATADHCQCSASRPDRPRSPPGGSGMAADPAAPGDVRAEPGGDRNVDLSWQRNPEPDILYYQVSRKDGGGNFSHRGDVRHPASGRPAFTDTSTSGTAGGEFAYRVVAVRKGASGDDTHDEHARGASGEKSVTVAPPPTTVAPGTPGAEIKPAGTDTNIGGYLAGQPGALPSPKPMFIDLPDTGFEGSLPFGQLPGEDMSEPGEGEEAIPATLETRRLQEFNRGRPLIPIAAGAILLLLAAHLRLFNKRLKTDGRAAGARPPSSSPPSTPPSTPPCRSTSRPAVANGGHHRAPSGAALTSLPEWGQFRGVTLLPGRPGGGRGRGRGRRRGGLGRERGGHRRRSRGRDGSPRRTRKQPSSTAGPSPRTSRAARPTWRPTRKTTRTTSSPSWSRGATTSSPSWRPRATTTWRTGTKRPSPSWRLPRTTTWTTGTTRPSGRPGASRPSPIGAGRRGGATISIGRRSAPSRGDRALAELELDEEPEMVPAMVPDEMSRRAGAGRGARTRTRTTRSSPSWCAPQGRWYIPEQERTRRRDRRRAGAAPLGRWSSPSRTRRGDRRQLVPASGPVVIPHVEAVTEPEPEPEPEPEVERHRYGHRDAQSRGGDQRQRLGPPRRATSTTSSGRRRRSTPSPRSRSSSPRGRAVRRSRSSAAAGRLALSRPLAAGPPTAPAAGTRLPACRGARSSSRTWVTARTTGSRRRTRTGTPRRG